MDYPQKDDEFRKMMKQKSDNHSLAWLSAEVDVHSWVLPPETQHRMPASSDQARAYVAGSNYSFFSVPVKYEARLSDAVAELSPGDTSGLLEIPPVEKGQHNALNWRFWQLRALVTGRRAEVLCDWKPIDNSSSPARTQVKITTA